MGHYAVYIWASYAVVGGLVVALIVTSLLAFYRAQRLQDRTTDAEDAS